MREICSVSEHIDTVDALWRAFREKMYLLDFKGAVTIFKAYAEEVQKLNDLINV